MLTYILLDLDLSSWAAAQQDGTQSGEEDPFDCLLILVSALQRCSSESVVRIVSGCAVIYDSERDGGMERIVEYEREHGPTGSGLDMRVRAADMGYALVFGPSRVIVYSFSEEMPSEYLKYVKCMFVAQKSGCRIDAVSARRNVALRMCCGGTGGVYLSGCSIREMLGLLGHTVMRRDVFMAACYCCSKRVSIGYVCPVCLSIYCKFLPVCRQCKTKFSFAHALREA